MLFNNFCLQKIEILIASLVSATHARRTADLLGTHPHDDTWVHCGVGPRVQWAKSREARPDSLFSFTCGQK
jgi:hypothetical protein